MIAPLRVHIKKDKQKTMNKKIIITALFALVAMAGQGQVVWEEPMKAYTTSPLFEVRLVS